MPKESVKGWIICVFGFLKEMHLKKMLKNTFKKNRVVDYQELCDLYMQWRNGKKYDETYLEIKKIEHALKKLEEMFELMEFTEDEINLINDNYCQELCYHILAGVLSHFKM